MRGYNKIMLDEILVVGGKLLLDALERAIRLRRERIQVNHDLEMNKAIYATMGITACFFIALILASHTLGESS